MYEKIYDLQFSIFDFLRVFIYLFSCICLKYLRKSIKHKFSKNSRQAPKKTYFKKIIF